jgi:hypothetical protein
LMYLSSGFVEASPRLTTCPSQRANNSVCESVRLTCYTQGISGNAWCAHPTHLPAFGPLHCRTSGCRQRVT